MRKLKATKATKGTKSRVTEKNRLKRQIISAFLLAGYATSMFGEIVPDPITMSKAKKTATGIDQLDIAAPNRKGMSYNAMKKLNVEESGLILNNNDKLFVDTQIAGKVARNQNLKSGELANLIVTEVTSNDRTTMSGYVEVAGQKSDILMANKNGITVNGGGFINADRATLTTGKVNIAGDDITGISVTQGDIAIDSKGIDVTRQKDFIMSSKTSSIDGAIRGAGDTKAKLAAGSHNLDYGNNSVTGHEAKSSGVAIDGKALGSMYAGTIDIIANDKGAGVNWAGTITGIDDINLTANGDIVTSGDMVAQKINLKSDKLRNSGKIQGTNTNLAIAKELDNSSGEILSPEALVYKGEKLVNNKGNISTNKKLEIDSKNVENKEGLLYATNDINISADTLDNTKGNVLSDKDIGIKVADTNNTTGQIVAKNIDITGNIVNKSGAVSTNNLAIKGSVDNTDGVLVAKDINIAGNNLSNTKGGISSDTLAINMSNIDNTTGKIISTVSGIIDTNTLTNVDGDIAANKLTTMGQTNNNTGRIYVNDTEFGGNVSNAGGAIHADTTKITGDVANTAGTIAAKQLGITGELNNTMGEILVTNADIAGNVTNAGGKLLADTMTLTGNKLDNTNKGTLAADTLDVSYDDIDNSTGTMAGTKSGSVKATNLVNNSGNLVSNGELALDISKKIDNTSGTLSGGIDSLVTKTIVNNGGRILSSKDFAINGQRLDNAKGEVYSEQKLNISMNNINSNEGYISGEAGLNVSASSIDNTKGTLGSLKDVSISGNTTNNGGKIVGDNLTLAGNTDNTNGNISGNDVIASGTMTNNSGTISVGKLTANTSSFNNNSGKLESNDITVSGILTNNNGTISAGKLTANTSSFDNNSGKLEGNDITVSGTVTNNNGTISASKLIANTSSFDNNSGKLEGNDITVSGTVTNNNGTISAGNLTANTSSFNNNSGNVDGKGAIKIQNLSNRDGKVYSTGYIGINNTGSLDTTNGTIHVDNEKSGVEVVTKGNLLYDNAKISSTGSINVDTVGTIGYDNRIDGKVSTNITADDVYTLWAINKDGTLGLTGRNSLVLGGGISAENVVLNSNYLLFNHDIYGTNGVYLKGTTIDVYSTINGNNVTSLAGSNVNNFGIIGTSGAGAVNVNVSNQLNNSKMLGNGSIYGKEVYINGTGSLNNTGTRVHADNNLVISLDGNVLNDTTLTTVTNGNLTETVIKDQGTLTAGGNLYIYANNIDNKVGVIAGGTGTVLDAKGDITDSTYQLAYEGNNVYMGNSPYDVTWEYVGGYKNIGGTIGNGGNTILNAKNNITLIKSTINAGDTIILNADNTLQAFAVTDKDYRYKDDERSYRKGLNKYYVTEYWEVNDDLAKGSTFNAGKNILINTGLSDEKGTPKATLNKGTLLQEVTMNANGVFKAESQGDIYTQGAKDLIKHDHEKHTERKLGWITTKNKNEKHESYMENYNKSSIYGNLGVSYDAGGYLIVEGTDITTEGNLILKGDKGVILKPGVVNSVIKDSYKTSGLYTSWDHGRSTVTAGIGWGKTNVSSSVTSQDIINNTFTVGGDYIVKSENGDYTHISTDLIVNGNADVTAKNIYIYDAQSYKLVDTKNESTNIGLSVKLGMPIIESIMDASDAIKDLKDSDDKWDMARNGYDAYKATKEALGDLKDTFKSLESVKSSLVTATGSLKYTHDNTHTIEESSTSKGSTIKIQGNTILNGDNLHVRGSELDIAGDLGLNIKNDVLIEAGKNGFSSVTEKGSTSLGVSVPLIGAHIPSFSGSVTGDDTASSSITFSSSYVNAGGNTNYNVGGNVTIRGAEVETGTISGNVGNLTIESLQNATDTDNKTLGFSTNGSFGSYKKAESDGSRSTQKGLHLSSFGGNFSYSETDSLVTKNVTDFKANGGTLTVGDTVNLTGASIRGNFDIDAQNYNTQKLQDITYSDKYGASLTIRPKASELYTIKGEKTGKYVDNLDPKTKGTFVISDKTQDVYATIGKRTGILTNGEAVELENVNRDLSKLKGEVDKNDHVNFNNVDLYTDRLVTEGGRSQLYKAVKEIKSSVPEIIDKAQEWTEKIQSLDKEMISDAANHIKNKLNAKAKVAEVIKGVKETLDSIFASEESSESETAKSDTDGDVVAGSGNDDSKVVETVLEGAENPDADVAKN